MAATKEENREKLQEIANAIGDSYLMEMFWDMFDDLSATNQKQYIQRAKRIYEDQTGNKWRD